MRKLTPALLLFLLPATASAENVYWVPAAAHAAGLGSSIWRTDLALLNLEAAGGSVELRLHGASGTSSRSFEIGPGRQQIFEDVVSAIVAGDASGSLEVVSDRILSVRSRTYNETPAGTFGQSLDGVTRVGGLSPGDTAILVALEESGTFRTNLGIVNAGDGEAEVTATLYSAEGSVVGTFPVSVPAGQLHQEVRPFASRFGRTDIRGGTARVTVEIGGPLFVYASVIDNRTGDPTTIAMELSPDCS